MIKILCCYRKGFCLVVEDLATLDENPGFLIVDSGVRTIEYIGPTFLKELERIKKFSEGLIDDGTNNPESDFFCQKTPVRPVTRSRKIAPKIV
jgi:hypothetical protein